MTNSLQRAIDALNGIANPSPALAQYIAQSVAHFEIEVKNQEDFAAWEARLDAARGAWDALTLDEQARVNRTLAEVLR